MIGFSYKISAKRSHVAKADVNVTARRYDLMRVLIVTLAMPLLVLIDQYQFKGHYGAIVGHWLVLALK